MAKKQPIFAEFFWIFIMICIFVVIFLIIFFDGTPNNSLIFVFIFVLFIFFFFVFAVMATKIATYKANKLIAPAIATAELPTNISASLALNSRCKYCDSPRIIKGKLTDNKNIFLKSNELDVCSSPFKNIAMAFIPKPIYEIEDLYFNYCINCGHIGGFTSVEMLQLSLKAHATEAALERLNLVNDLEQE